MDQQAHLLLKTIAHHHKQQAHTNTIHGDDTNTVSPQGFVFKTWLSLKLIRWEIEIKRAVKTPQRSTVGA